MSGADTPEGGAPTPGAPDEFGDIARLLRPLTGGAPEALGLLDDAAIIPSRPGQDLVITKDAMVEGVHALPGADRALFARRLLRTNLSDLAAMGAEPYAAFLAVAWPKGSGVAEREAFARGLAEDFPAFGVKLLGGDTVSTEGPLVASMTLLGFVPAGRAIKRSTARPGDLVMVSGPIGDGGLGLAAAQGRLDDASGHLQRRYWLPDPRLDLIEALRADAHAAIDVSDGLIADAGHVAEASGVQITLDLERAPLSAPAADWLADQPDPLAGRLHLVSAGDDYELVITAAPEQARRLALPVIGAVTAGSGLQLRWNGVEVQAERDGWRHG